jgi:hypothetical protein
MVYQRRRVLPGRRAPVVPAPPSPQVLEALFCDLEAVGRPRPRNRAAVDAYISSPAVGALSMFPPSVRRRALRQLPHGIPTAKSWLAVCRLSPVGRETATRHRRSGPSCSR